MNHALLTAILLLTAAPLAAQGASTPSSGQPAPATPFTAEQIAAFNAAIATFTEGQKAQQVGDNAAALAKYEAALPAIRDVVKAQPDNIANVNFLASVLYATAAANAGLGKMEALVPLYEESLPYWRQVVASKQDMPNRNVLAGILTQLGNAKLSAQDKVGAMPLYAEALSLAHRSVAERADLANRNLLLGALIGASQANDDPALKEEVTALSKEMLADNSVSAVNRPAAEILAAAGSEKPRAK